MSLVVLCACTLHLATQSVTGLQDPRPASLVLDQAGILDAGTEQRIDTVLLALDLLDHGAVPALDGAPALTDVRGAVAKLDAQVGAGEGELVGPGVGLGAGVAAVA